MPDTKSKGAQMKTNTKKNGKTIDYYIYYCGCFFMANNMTEY